MDLGRYRPLIGALALLGGCQQGGDRSAPVPPGPEAPHVLGATPREALPDAAVATRAVDAGPPLPGPAAARAQAIAAARNAGILGALARANKGHFTSLFGKGDIKTVLDDKDIQGGLLGNQVGDLNGLGGLGSSGSGLGGGGTGVGGRGAGIGTLGTIGHGSGGGGIGFGSGSGRAPKAGPTISMGVLTGAPDADRSIFSHEVQRRAPALLQCFTARLIDQPVSGAVSFMVGSQGGVSGVTTSGVDGDVGGCIKSAIENSVFPAPLASRAVTVRAPFSFRPAP